MDPTGGILSYVVNKLGDLLLSEVDLLGNTRRDLEWVQRELRMMQAVLDHVATMKIEDVRTKIWIEDVQKLAFHAEDVVDTFSIHASIPTRKSFLSCCIPPIKSKHVFGMEVKQLRERVDELSKMKERYSVRIPDTTSVGTVDRAEDLVQIWRQKASYGEDRDLVGFGDSVKAVTELLDREKSKRSVVGIVGMGGLGKTTLAKKVYDNILRSSSSFDCNAWVDVSQKFNILDLLRSMARGFTKLSSEDVEKMDQRTVSEKLCNFIQCKKYLLVLDDVWTSELWGLLDTILPDQDNGSRIIITTRNKEVARSANPELPPYELPTLGEEDSRELFTKKAFPGEKDPEQCCTGKGLASLREAIVNKCGGLPLALVVVGGLLSRKEKTPEVWGKVAEKIDWQQREQGGQCMGILALSYMDLPLHLRWCFLYLACLPEDCEARVDLLQRLWIAEGFVEERAGASSMEEEAERCLQELVQRCLLQLVQISYIVRRDDWRVERCCRVHDLVLELAVSEAKKMRFLDVWRNPMEGSPDGSLIRRLSITNYKESAEAHIHRTLQRNKLRTLLIRDREDWKPYLFFSICKIDWYALRGNLKLLRVLDLAVHIVGVPEGIEEMVNLRYLALSGDILKLPESVGNLRHLQTLDLEMTGIKYLPRSIWKIKTLRYLRGSLYGRTFFPMIDASLRGDTFNNLRVLRGICVSPEMEKIFPYLTRLRELDLRDVDALSMSSLSTTIKESQCLRELILDTGGDYSQGIRFEMDEIFSATDSHKDFHSLVLTGFLIVSSQPPRVPRNLRQVHLGSVKIHHCIIELLGNLNHLQQLGLRSVSFIEEDDEEFVFRTGWFPQLCVLHLQDLKGFKMWEMEQQSMPLLEELYIIGCSELEELPEGLWHIGTLRSLQLWDNNQQLQERYQEPRDGRREGRDWHKIQHIEYVLGLVSTASALFVS